MLKIRREGLFRMVGSAERNINRPQSKRWTENTEGSGEFENN